MKYYSEDEMKEIRVVLENEVLNWPGVTTKKMFGCPCYKANNKLFGFVVTNGIVLTKLSDTEQVEVRKEFKSEPFQAGKRTVNGWPRIQINNRNEPEKILPSIKKSYENAVKA